MDFLQKSMPMFYAPYQQYYDMDWPMQQSKMIHRFRNVRVPPIKDPQDDKAIKWLLVCEQFHGRWSDVSLIHALVSQDIISTVQDIDFYQVDIEQAFGPNIVQYGGRDKSNRTWVKFYKARYPILDQGVSRSCTTVRQPPVRRPRQPDFRTLAIRRQ